MLTYTHMHSLALGPARAVSRVCVTQVLCPEEEEGPHTHSRTPMHTLAHSYAAPPRPSPVPPPPRRPLRCAEFVKQVCPETWTVGDGKVVITGAIVRAEKEKVEFKVEEETLDQFGNVIKVRAGLQLFSFIHYGIVINIITLHKNWPAISCLTTPCPTHCSPAHAHVCPTWMHWLKDALAQTGLNTL